MMKHIDKKSEPASLRQFRAGLKKEDYFRKDIFDTEFPQIAKKELREFLLEEQGYICCYCMQRINVANTKIEHLKAQSKHPKSKFDYQNLFIACKGNEGIPPEKQHCDTRKGYYEKRQIEKNIEYEITINPADKNQNCEQYIKYRSNGEINFDNLDSAIREDLEDALNLNYPILVSNRRQTLKAVIDQLNRKQSGEWKKQFIQKMIQKYERKNAKGKYLEYCQVVIYFLKKRIGEI